MEIASLVLGLQSGLGSDDTSSHRHRLSCDSIREGLQGSGEAGDPERSSEDFPEEAPSEDCVAWCSKCSVNRRIYHPSGSKAGTGVSVLEEGTDREAR